MSETSQLTIYRVQAISYRQPAERTFELQGEEAASRNRTNLAFFIDGRTGAGTCKGVGEAFVGSEDSPTVPRSSWDFVEAACRRLNGRVIPMETAAAAQQAVGKLMNELHALAHATSPDPARKRPFNDTLTGVTVALVSLVQAAFDFEGGPETAGNDGAREAQRRRAAEQLRIFYERALEDPMRYVCFPDPPMPTFQGKPANTYPGVTYMHPLGSNGTKGHLLEREALALGLTTIRYAKGTFIATDGVKDPLIFKWSRSPISSCVSLALCTHKEATRARLRREGVPAPRGRMFRNGDYDSAYAFADRIGYPVVCKPATGVRGIGVVANIQNRSELKRAFDQMANSRLGGDDFIVEKHVTGNDYRIIVLDGEVIACILREPASVVGDGEHTIAELMLQKNAARRLNPHLWGRPAKYGDAARYQLERAGLTVTSVPEKNRRVLLANTCSLSQGGDSIDVLDELHPTVRDAAVAAVLAIPGLRYCGVDFLMEDHRKPIHEQSAGICELNAHAAIGNCEYPLFGEPRLVARQFMQRCAETYGLKVHDKPAEQLSIKLRVRGAVTGVGYRAWMQ
jgi:D-alanine-D-alanine ligase-like ATP-grasp enzyme